MGLTKLGVSIIITALFALAIVNFGVLLAYNNNLNQTILNDPAFASLNETLTEELSPLQDTAQTQREIFEQQEAQGGSSDEGFSLTAIVGNTKTFFSVAIGSFNAIFALLADALGIPPIVFNILMGIIIFTILILIWRTIKVGGT